MIGSERQRILAEMIVEGKGNKEIAHRMGWSLYTTKQYILEMRKRLGAAFTTRVELANLLRHHFHLGEQTQ